MINGYISVDELVSYKLRTCSADADSPISWTSWVSAWYVMQLIISFLQYFYKFYKKFLNFQ